MTTHSRQMVCGSEKCRHGYERQYQGEKRRVKRLKRWRDQLLMCLSLRHALESSDNELEYGITLNLTDPFTGEKAAMKFDAELKYERLLIYFGKFEIRKHYAAMKEGYAVVNQMGFWENGDSRDLRQSRYDKDVKLDHYVQVLLSEVCEKLGYANTESVPAGDKDVPTIVADTYTKAAESARARRERDRKSSR